MAISELSTFILRATFVMFSAKELKNFAARQTCPFKSKQKMNRKIITQNFKKKTQYFFAISVFSAFILRPFSHVPCQKSARFRCAAEFCLYPSRKYNFYVKIIKKSKKFWFTTTKLRSNFCNLELFAFILKVTLIMFLV